MDIKVSIEEIIEGLEETVDTMQKFGVCHLKLKTADILRAAIAKLKTHQDNQLNDPLTLEELREMDGQPVWVQPYNAEDFCAPNGWAIATVQDDGAKCQTQHHQRGCD